MVIGNSDIPSRVTRVGLSSEQFKGITISTYDTKVWRGRYRII
jgi:hypothetical protein